MKSFMLATGSGLIVVLTSHASLTEPALLGKLHAKGIDKFIAWEIPIDMAKARYGGHFQVVVGDLLETDDLRVLDFNGERIFRLFEFRDLGEPIFHEGPGGGRAEAPERIESR